MAILKLNKAQYELLMNDPVHYNVSMSCNSKDYTWECTCDAATAVKVKAVVDER